MLALVWGVFIRYHWQSTLSGFAPAGIGVRSMLNFPGALIVHSYYYCLIHQLLRHLTAAGTGVRRSLITSLSMSACSIIIKATLVAIFPIYIYIIIIYTFIILMFCWYIYLIYIFYIVFEHVSTKYFLPRSSWTRLHVYWIDLLRRKWNTAAL